jgi:TATA-box binding protein (TBP) (component of TFIID and TFIIIB)
MEVVNAVYHGDLERHVDLLELHNKLPNSKHYTHKPVMVLLKEDGATMMIFGSGKFRIMGMVDELDATFKVISVFSKIGYGFPVIKLQTMTVKFRIKPVNLTFLSKLIESQLELELFPALLIKKYKPISVNVFSSGAVVICGVKDMDIVNVIKNDLESLYK